MYSLGDRTDIHAYCPSDCLITICSPCWALISTQKYSNAYRQGWILQANAKPGNRVNKCAENPQLLMDTEGAYRGPGNVTVILCSGSPCTKGMQAVWCVTENCPDWLTVACNTAHYPIQGLSGYQSQQSGGKAALQAARDALIKTGLLSSSETAEGNQRQNR